MTISIEKTEFIRPEQFLYASSTTIDAIAKAIVASMTEASIDMICDGGATEYPTRESIEECLSGTPDMGVDFVNDMFDELKQSVIDRLQNINVKAKVLSIRFDDNGHYDDVEVKLDVETKV